MKFYAFTFLTEAIKMNTLSKVANNLIPERIQRLNTLMAILPAKEQHGLTINEIVSRHVSALGLSGRKKEAKYKIVSRGLSDLANEGQISHVGGRPKKFFKFNSDISTQANPSGLTAANDESTPLCHFSLLTRIKFDVASISSLSAVEKQKINFFLEIIKSKKKADFFYLSKSDALKSRQPTNLKVDVVGIIIKSSGLYVAASTLSTNIKCFDIKDITDIKSTRFNSNALNKDSDAESVLQIALSMAIELGTLNSHKRSKPNNKMSR
jgi:hypothetical protein